MRKKKTEDGSENSIKDIINLLQENTYVPEASVGTVRRVIIVF